MSALAIELIECPPLMSFLFLESSANYWFPSCQFGHKNMNIEKKVYLSHLQNAMEGMLTGVNRAS